MRETVRLNVNLNEATSEALERICDESGVTLTEAVRRSISVYAFVRSEIAQGNKVLVQDSNGRLAEVILL